MYECMKEIFEVFFCLSIVVSLESCPDDDATRMQGLAQA